jgi:hypothetical protein
MVFDPVHCLQAEDVAKDAADNAPKVADQVSQAAHDTADTVEQQVSKQALSHTLLFWAWCCCQSQVLQLKMQHPLHQYRIQMMACWCRPTLVRRRPRRPCSRGLRRQPTPPVMSASSWANRSVDVAPSYIAPALENIFVCLNDVVSKLGSATQMCSQQDSHSESEVAWCCL